MDKCCIFIGLAKIAIDDNVDISEIQGELKEIFESNVIVDQNNVRDLLMSMSSISISGLEAIYNGEYSNKVFVGPECSEYINLFDNNLVSLNGKVDSDRLKLFCDSLLSEESKGISEDFGLKKTLGNVRK